MRGTKHAVMVGAAVIALRLLSNAAAAQDYSAVDANGTLKLGGYGNFFIPGNLETCRRRHTPIAKCVPERLIPGCTWSTRCMCSS